jgi:hypothetical protein
MKGARLFGGAGTKEGGNEEEKRGAPEFRR